MNVIIDSNVLISSVLVENSIPDRAFELAQRKHTSLCSESVFKEYEEKLLLPKFDKYS